MSTRCNIKIVEGKRELWFYKHSDGYPEGTMPLLEKFMAWLKEKAIRDNISQSAGWLVYLGMQEYGIHEPNKLDDFSGWKVGSIEPTTGQHGDIEFLYTIDLIEKTLKVEDL